MALGISVASIDTNNASGPTIRMAVPSVMPSAARVGADLRGQLLAERIERQREDRRPGERRQERLDDREREVADEQNDGVEQQLAKAVGVRAIHSARF